MSPRRASSRSSSRCHSASAADVRCSSCPHDLASAGLFLHKLANWFSPGKNPITGFVYAAIIVFFTYFYTAVTMNVEHIADELKKYGSYIPGIRPGQADQEYLDKVMTRITLAGALFLALIALLQYWIPALTNTQGANQLHARRRHVAADRRRCGAGNDAGD